MSHSALAAAAEILRRSRCTLAFTGAGVSVESGITPFRGPGGLWAKHDPGQFEISYFRANPGPAWRLLKTLFYEDMAKARPNPAHLALARLAAAGRLAAVVTQNIDGLHQAAGSPVVHEYHGSTRELLCLDCGALFAASDVPLEVLPPACPSCKGLLKPDIVFFGEPIPEKASRAATEAARHAEAVLVVGTTGGVMPAAAVPLLAKQCGAGIVEVNIRPSAYTHSVTDVFLEGPAGRVVSELVRLVLGE